MEKRFAKKAVRPILNLISERINMEILPEFGLTDYEFKWDDYDLDEDIKRHELYKLQIDMGIKTPEMVAEEEHIDVAELKAQKEEQEAKDADKFDREAKANFGDFGNSDNGDEKKNKNIQSVIKHKYVRRTGGKGNYTYYYADGTNSAGGKKENSIDKHLSAYKSHHDGLIKSLSKSHPGRKIYGRMKEKESILGKLKRKPDQYKSIEDLRDISGIRVESKSLEHVYNDVERIKKEHNVVEVKDYVSKPQGGVYRSVHIIVEKNGKYSELQVRTKNMTIMADYMHDSVYKIPPGKETVIEKHKSDINKYLESFAEYFHSEDRGLKGFIPGCIEVIKKTIGCLEV